MELTNIWCNEIEYPEMYTPSYLKDKNLLIEKVIDETRRLLFHTNEHWNGLYKYGYEITNPMTPEIRQHKACLTFAWNIRRIPHTEKKSPDRFLDFTISHYKEDLIGTPKSLALINKTLFLVLDFQNLLDEAEAGRKKMQRAIEQMKAEERAKREAEKQREREAKRAEIEYKQECARIQREREEIQKRMARHRREHERQEIWENLYDPMNEFYAEGREIDRVYRKLAGRH